MGSQQKKQDRGWRCVPISQAADAPQERRDRAQDRPLLIPAGQGEQEGQAGEKGLPCSGSGPQAERRVTHSCLEESFQLPDTLGACLVAKHPLATGSLASPTSATSISAHTASLYPAASHTCSDGSHSVCLVFPSLGCTSRTHWLCSSMAHAPASASPTLSPHNAVLHIQ